MRRPYHRAQQDQDDRVAPAEPLLDRVLAALERADEAA